MHDDFTEEGLYRSLYKQRVPDHIHETFVQYILIGRPTGGFCMAVLCNDLVGAVIRADQTNRINLIQTVSWMYNDIPTTCWGSIEIYRAWMSHQGLMNIPMESETSG